MKATTKKTLIITSIVLGVILILGLILGFVPIRRVCNFSDFSVAWVYSQNARAGVQVNSSDVVPAGDRYSEHRNIANSLTDALDTTSFTVLHAMFEGRLGGTVRFNDEYDEDGIPASMIADIAAPTEYEFVLRLRFDSVRYITVSGERVYYDTLIFFVPDSSNEIIWIDVYAYDSGRLALDDNLTYNSPVYYYVRPLRMRAVTTRLYRALGDIVGNPLLA